MHLSGVGKLSQLVFAIVAPGHVVANIVAGALAEAGAMQPCTLYPVPGGRRGAAPIHPLDPSH